jgi:hypothetical protein
MEFCPLDRKWNNCTYQSLVETWSGDTAKDTVQGRNSGLEFQIGVLERTQIDIDYP